MQKILEVLRYGEDDIRFDTDINPEDNPEIIHDLIVEIALAFVTKLWGGKEQAVLAMIRALIVADLGVSVNREQMIKLINAESAYLEQVMKKVRDEVVANGGTVFTPGTPNPVN